MRTRTLATIIERANRCAVVPVLFLLVCVLPALSQAPSIPSITNVTNAAIPAIDIPPKTAQLAPRSIATIFGTNLADDVVPTAPPWPQTLGGTEVHIVFDTIILNNFRLTCDWRSDPSCEITAMLTYASPTQINFVTPDAYITASNGNTAPVLKVGRIVLIRDGVRVDARYDLSSGPGYVTVDPFGYTRNPAVFGVGNDCLFSFSLMDPSSCGLQVVDYWDGISGLFSFGLPDPPACGSSCSPNPHRALLGAVTDAAGQLITSQNPVRQGQPITLWMTGLIGLSPDPNTGSVQQVNPTPVGFGVAQNGSDIPATVTYDGFDGVNVGLFKTPPPVLAGESFQFVGLDQVLVNFPACVAATQATVEKRYDAFMEFVNIAGTTARIYLPFLVSPGDSDCQSQWATTATTLTSSLNPSTAGQAVTFTANVTPSTATGTVVFLDGAVKVGAGTVIAGKATLSTSSLAAGSHAIAAGYGGDSNYNTSNSNTLTQTVTGKIDTTTTLKASPGAGGGWA
jgi:hypothetical protein